MIGDGDLTRDVRSGSKDEIGELSRIVDNMRKKVGQTVGESMCIAEALAEAASEQAASVEGTSSSLEEMSSMTKQNAENANNANSLMKEANQVIVAANESMGGGLILWERFRKTTEVKPNQVIPFDGEDPFTDVQVADGNYHELISHLGAVSLSTALGDSPKHQYLAV